MLPIIDLHCDLLGYLHGKEGGGPDDVSEIGCARPHLRAGGVKLQVCALFALTGEGSAEAGMAQAEIFRDLIREGVFKRWTKELDWEEIKDDGHIYVLPAIENASCFAGERDRIEEVLYRMEMMMAITGKPLYITITHHAENRFGGGNLTKVGLKPDGAMLLEYLDKRGIAVDLSHTSDLFAHEIFKYISARELEIPLIASHSNFRSVHVHARNLDQGYADYLFKKEGIIGLNFVKDFIGPTPETFVKHLQHGHERGAKMAFGGDYFPPSMMSPEYARPGGYFFEEHKDARCYPGILEAASSFMDETALRALSYQNALDFMRRLGF